MSGAGERAPERSVAPGHDGPTSIRVALPAHLRDLARVDGDVEVRVDGEPTAATVLDALEAAFPALRGTVRDQVSGERRAYIRYFACGEDLSHEPPDSPLPEAVREGREVFRILGAIAGG